MPSKGAGTLARKHSRPWHMWRKDGQWVERAGLTEDQAHEAVARLADLTGHRCLAYACWYPHCRAWHIRPDRPLRLERRRGAA